MTLAQLFYAKHPRRQAGHRRRRRAKPLLFEGLESRLLLSVDPVILTPLALDTAAVVLTPEIRVPIDPSPASPGRDQGERPAVSRAPEPAREVASLPGLSPVALTLDRLAFEPMLTAAEGAVEFRATGEDYQLTLAPDEWRLTLMSPMGGGAVVRMELTGANPLARGSGHEGLPGVTNYALGDDPARWMTGVPSFGRVRYDGVYAGIDLEYYGADGDLEYDWRVAPGADPGAITLAFSGSTGLELDRTGDLIIHTEAGDLIHHAPVLYQEVGEERVAVSGRYAITDRGAVGFHVGDYDRSRELVIDPVLGYSTYLGGSGNDSVTGIATDSAGNTYVVGTTTSAALAGRATGATGIFGRAFVTKFDPAGQIAYTTVLGPTTKIDTSGYAHSKGEAIAIGPDGAPRVVFDSVEGQTVPLSGGGLFPRPAPHSLHIAKLSTEGIPVFDVVQSTFTDDVLGTFQSFNGTGGASIAVDGAGAAYVSVEAVHPGGQVLAFLSKVDAAGQSQFTRELFVAPQDIAVDGAGNIYLTATTSQTDLPVSSGAFQAAKKPGARPDLYVAKLDPTGAGLLAATYLGGADYDLAGGLALNPHRPGSVYLSGTTASSDFPLENSLQPHNLGKPGTWDGFATILDLDAMTIVASTYLGGSGAATQVTPPKVDVLSDIAVDPDTARVYVVGETSSLDFPLANPLQAEWTSGSPLGNIGPPYDLVVATLDVMLSTLQFSTYVGGSGHDSGSAAAPDLSGTSGGPKVAIGRDGTIHVAATSSSANFPTVRAAQPIFGGPVSNFPAGALPKLNQLGSDAVVLAIQQPGTLVGRGGQAVAGQVFSGVVADFSAPSATASPGDFAATIDWGDGTQSSGQIVRPGSAAVPFQVLGSHQYENVGAYPVRVVVTQPATGLGPQTNVNISVLPGVQFEPAIAVDPAHPERLFAAAVDETGLKNVLAGAGGGLFVSTSDDGGRTWAPRRIAADAAGNPLPAALGDPKAIFDGFGNLFLTYLGAARNNVVLAVSKDGGLTFRTIANLSPAGGPTGPSVPLSVDQPSVAVGAGTVWITYADTLHSTLVAAGAPVTGLDQVGALTSFTVPGALGGFGDIGIGPAGEVLVLWEEGVSAPAAPPYSVFTSLDPDGLGPVPFGEPRLLARTFTPVAPFAFMPHQGIDSEFNLAWDPKGGAKGRVYVAYTEPTPPPGDPANLTDLDIYLRYSDDAGATWQGPVKVSDAPVGTFQFLSSIALDQRTGDVAVGWYDTRRDPEGLFTDFMVAVSHDRGASFSRNQRVSLDVSSATLLDATVVGRGKGYGDYSTLAFHDGVLHPVWADNSVFLSGIPDRPQLDVATAAIGVIDVAAAPLTIQPRAVQAFEDTAFTGIVATFLHPDSTRRSDDFTATIDWGDGIPATAGIVTGPNTPTFSITGTHTFADTGIFPVQVTVRDKVTGVDAVAVSNVTRHPANQAEGTVAIDPTNPNRVFAAAVHLPLDSSFGLRVAVSEDGGATWTPRTLATGSDGLPAGRGDPRAAFDQFGNLFLTYITPPQPDDRIVVLLSVDGGQTFSVLESFSDPRGMDQPTVATGPGTGGAGGSVWVTFQRDGADGDEIFQAAGAPVSGLGAVGAFTLTRVSPATVDNRNFGDVAVGPQGQVLVSYQISRETGPSSLVVHLDPDGVGPAGFGPAIAITDTAVGATHELPAQRLRPVDAEGNLAWDRSGGDFRGRVYFAYTDVAPSGNATDTEIFLRVSEDGGATWGERIRVNDDPAGSSQFLPSLAVDQTTGALGIGWHSTQGDPANVKTGFFATTSGDGGASFARRVRLSAGDSDATDPGLDVRGKGFQFGDYTGLAFQSGVLDAVWGDNSAELGGNPNPPQLELASGRLGVASVVGAPLSVAVLPPDGLVEGQEFSGRVGRFTDPQPESGVTADDYSATISWGDGTDPSAATIVADGLGGYLVRGTHQYRRFGSYALKVTVEGRGASPGTAAGSVKVDDAPITPSPVFVRLVDDVVFADTLPGPPFDDVVATFTDANPFGLESDFSATIDWDTANADQPGLIASVIGPSGNRIFLVRGNNTYHDEGGYAVEVAIKSAGSDEPVEVTSIFTVGDPALEALAPPGLSALEGVDTGRILLGSFLIGGPVDFGDPAISGVDTWEAEVDWGDGSLPEQLDETAVLIEPIGPFPNLPNHVRARLHVVGDHAYADGGVHAGTLTITSDSGDSQSFDLSATVALDVTGRVRVVRNGMILKPPGDPLGGAPPGSLYVGDLFITNTGSDDLNGPFALLFDNVPAGITLVNVPHLTAEGDPVLTIDHSRLLSGASLPPIALELSDPDGVPISYSVKVFAGARPDSPATAGLVFEPNLGQASDSVSYVAVGTSYAIGLAADHAALALRGDAGSAGAGALMEWVGGNDSPVLRPLEPLPGVSNYLTGDGSIIGVPHYGRVHYESVYDGIDLEYYGRQGQLEFDWIVRPGADVSDIAVRFGGVHAITPDGAGNLRLRIDDGELIQRAPLAYQVIDGARRRVAASFETRPDGTIGLAVGDYDPGRTLVIDPVLVYSTYLGGSGVAFLGGADSAQAVAVDAQGNSYVTGSTVSPDFPTADAFDHDLNEPATRLFQITRDAFITKFDPAGSVVFSTYLGGGTNDQLNPYGTVGRAIAVDDAGHVFVGGGTNSPLFPALDPAPIPVGPPSDRFGAFLTELAADGSAILYSTYLRGYGDINDLAVDGDGAVYAALGTLAPVAFKLDTEGNVAPWYRSFAFGGGATSIAVDGLGQTYLGGITTSPQFTPKNALFPTLPPDPVFPLDTRHAFVAKLSAAGDVLFATLLGGSGREFGGFLALDGAGSIYVSGTTESPDFPVPGGLDTSRGGSRDGFVVKLTNDGSQLLYGTYLGGSSDDAITGLGVDAQGRIYVAGTTQSPDLPTIHARQPAMAVQEVNGLSDGFVGAIAADGASLEYLTYLGGTGDDQVAGLAVDASGTATVVGRTGSLNFPLHNAFQNRPIFDDAFVVRLGPGSAGTLALRNAAVQVTEGSEFETLVASFTTNGVETAGQFSAIIDWGDGTASAGVIEGHFDTGFQIFGRHRYDDIGGHDVLVTLGDSLGRPVTASSTEAGGGLDRARYHVIIDTSSRTGSAGQLGFQFNPGAIPGGPEAQARIGGLRLAGGTVGAATAEGGASVDALGGIVLRPDTVLNRLLQTVTLGTSIEFDLEISGAGVGAPQNGTASDMFALQLFAPDGVTPLLGADSTGSLLRVELRPDGSTQARLTGPEVRVAALGRAIVANAPLDVDLMSFTVQEGLAFSGAVATLTSGNPLETADGFQAVIDWADGSPPTSGAVTFDGARFTVTGSHTYLRAGLYPFGVAVTEPDGATTATVSSSVVSPVQASYATFPASGPGGTVGGQFMASAELNGDGKLDAISTKLGSTTGLYVWLGDGDFGFGPAISVTTTNGPSTSGRGVAAGDFDADGIADLAIAGLRVEILLGNGDGTFAAGPAGPLAGGQFPASLAAGDFDGDGRTDLALGYFSSSQVSTFRGNGDGTFQAAVAHSVSFGSNWPVVSDLDRDGRADIVVAVTGARSVGVLLGAADGGFADVGPVDLDTNVVAIAVGDATGDAIPDIVAGGVDVVVRAGDGAGGFGIPVHHATALLPQQVAVGDLEGDGLAEIVVGEMMTEGSLTMGRLAVLRATPGGGFVASATLLGPSPGLLDLSDWNNDGNLDLAAASAPGLLLYPGRGDGTLQAARTELSGQGQRTVLTMDANGDGFADLVSGGQNGVVVSLGDGTGAYDEPSSRPLGVTATAVAMADFNGDGLLDLVGSTNSGLRVAFQTADGAYATPLGYGTSQVGEVAAADLDGDGAPDIVAAGPGNLVTILLNNGAGGFVAGPSFTPGTGPTSLLLRDLDGDGKTDLAVTVIGTFDSASVPRRFINAGVAVARGNGDGSFGPATIYAAGTTFQGWLRKRVAAGDLDNDGDLDLVVVAGAIPNPVLGTADQSGMFVLLGQGDGTFRAGPTYLTALPTPQILGSVALADFNRDGKLDAAIAQSVGATNRHDDVLIMAGNGDGTFGAPVALEGAGAAGEILAGDLNGDGRPDLIVGEQSISSVRSGLNVLLGRGDGTFGARMTYVTGDSFSMALGDANGDGTLDVAAADPEGGLLSIILGRGDGTLRAPLLTRIHEMAPVLQSGQVFALASADVNGDGRMDLAATYSYIPNLVVDIGGGDFQLAGGDEVGILLGNGDGTFQVRPPAIIPNYGLQTNGPNAWDIAVGDVNGDGQAEFVAGLRAPKRIVTIPLQPDGTLGIPKDHTGLAGGRISGGLYVIGDFNDDSRTDVAEIARFGLPDQATVTVFRGQPNLTFAAGPTYPIGSKIPVVTTERVLDAVGGDFNNDGHLDIAVSEGIFQNLTESGGLTVLLGNGDGSFRAPVVYAQGRFLGTLGTGDLDGDQDLDLVAVQGRTPRGIAVLSNSGSGSFAVSSVYDSNSPGLSFPDIATGDLAQDGVLDIAISNFGERRLRIIDVVPALGATVTNGVLSVIGATINPVAGLGFTAVVATLTDSNPLSTAGEYSATIDWGDGTTSDGAIAADGRGGFTVTGSHTYASTGLRTTAIRVNDDEGGAAAGTGVADVSASAAAIAASPVNFAATEDAPFDGVVATFTSADPNGSAADFTASINWGDGQTSSGAITASGPGTFRVVGRHTYANPGPVSVPVSINAISGASTNTVSTGQVAPHTNVAPTAAGDSYLVQEDTLLTVTAGQGILANDADADGDVLTAVLVSDPAYGAITLNLDGSFTYIPASDFSVSDSFTYRAADASLTSDLAVVMLAVRPVNDPPLAAADSAATGEDTPVTIDVLANDRDVDSALNPASVVFTGQPGHGTVRADAATGAIVYVPAANFFGPDSVRYRVADSSGKLSNEAVVSIAVLARNDAPVAVSDSYVAHEDTPLVVARAQGLLANDTDVDGDALTASLVSLPAHGALTPGPDGSFTYVPAAEFSGSDSFGYRVSDGTRASGPVTVWLIVQPLGDPPVIAPIASQLISEGGFIAVPGSFSDPDPDDAWTATVDFGDGSGAQPLALVGSTFVPNHTYVESGPYLVTASVADQTGRVATANFSVVVENRPPVIEAGSDKTASEGARVQVAATFSDPGVADTHTATIDWGDGTAVQAVSVDEASGAGSIAASHAYADDRAYAVTITVTDDEGAAASAGFTVTVTNAAPQVDGGPDRTVNEGELVSVPALIPSDLLDPSARLRAIDRLSGSYTDLGSLDGHTATVNWGDGTVESAPVAEGQFGPIAAPGGTSGVAQAAHRYGDDGPYTVLVGIRDGDGGIGSDAFAVTVLNVAPTLDVGADQEVGAGTAVSVAAPFSDPGVLDTHTATIDWGDGVIEAGLVQSSIADGVRVGAVSGSHVYASGGSFTVSVALTDDDGGAAVDTLRVRVTGGSGDTPPTALDDERTTDEDAGLIIDLLANDRAGDATIDPTTVAITAEPRHGTVLVDPTTGAVTYEPAADFSGADEFRYTVEDSAGLTSNAALVSLTVNPVNDPPRPDDIANRTLTEGGVLGLTGSFADPDPDDGWTATVDYGDGGGAQLLILTGTAFQLSHRYADDGVYAVRVVITDRAGTTGAEDFIASVENAPPTVEAGPDQPAVEARPVAVSAILSDPGSDTLEAAIDWGDGTTESVPVAIATGPGGTTGSLTASHVYTAPGRYQVVVSASDDDGGTGSDALDVLVANAAPAFTDLAATPAIDEGGTVLLTGRLANPGLDRLRLVVDWGEGTPETVALAVGAEDFALSHRYLDDAPSGTTSDPYGIRVQVFDDEGGETAGVVGTLVRNVEPTATLTAPPSGVRGVAVRFTGALTDPGLLDAHQVAWDFGDGTEVAYRPASDPGALTPTHTYAEDGAFTAVLSVRDDDGGVGMAQSVVVIAGNSPPVAQLVGPTGGVRGQRLAFTGSFTDPDTGDSHEVAVDWGDGTAIAFHPSTDPGALDLSHVYADARTYTVTWRVRDEHGAVGAASRPVTIAPVALQPDPADPDKLALVVGGTSGDDVITFSEDKSGGVRVEINRVKLGVFAPTGRLVAYGQGGDDIITVICNLVFSVELYGGEGNDQLKVVKGTSILVGGPGNDKLVGGAGRNLLIGGDGIDQITAAASEDIVIAGRTLYDDTPNALRAVMAEWTRTDLSYAQRVEHLRSGGGRNGAVRLDATAVFDDGVKDELLGRSGLDWFFAGAGDRSKDRLPAETLTTESRASKVTIAWSSPALAATPTAAKWEFAAPSIPQFAIEQDDAILAVSL